MSSIENNDHSLQSLLERCLHAHASDLHISANQKPMFRVYGNLVDHDDAPISSQQVEQLIGELLSEARNAELLKYGQVDLAYSLANGERFRINIYRESGKPAVAIRHLNNRFKSMSELHLPKQLADIPKLKNGLVLVCGSTGSGKSTTLASMLNDINNSRRCHILTIEDPVEFVHQNRMALIHQRELGEDVFEFSDALRAALRQDPDVIMVGEMRDLDTMKAALTAAETGHLVFSTLHTGDAVGVIDRLIGSFPGDEQEVARGRIAGALKAVVAQQLIPVDDGKGRVPAAEVLIVNNGVANLIQTGKTSQIYSAIESGKSEGMQTLEQALAVMVKARWINADRALGYSRNPQALTKLLNSRGLGNSNGHSGGKRHAY